MNPNTISARRKFEADKEKAVAQSRELEHQSFLECIRRLGKNSDFERFLDWLLVGVTGVLTFSTPLTTNNLTTHRNLGQMENGQKIIRALLEADVEIFNRAVIRYNQFKRLKQKGKEND